MRVVVDALSARVGGGLSYVRQQIPALIRVRPAWDILVLGSPHNEAALSTIHGASLQTIGTRSLAARLCFEQLVLPHRFARRADVLYCPGNFVPLRSRVPSVVAQQSPHYFGTGRRVSYRHGPRKTLEIWLAQASVRRAAATVVISESLLAEMATDGLASVKCTVIRSGRPEWTGPSIRPPSFAETRPFFLSLANDSPHKRLDDIVRAWAALPSASAFPLAMCGRFSTQRISEQIALAPPERRQSLLHLGSASRQGDVRWLLENCLASVSASALETFGLTLVEAGSVGAPLILSDIPVHREVAGAHASYFPPGDIPRLIEKLMEAAQSPPARSIWQWSVTWEDNARQLAALLEDASRATQP